MRAAIVWLALVPWCFACTGSDEGFLTVSWEIEVAGEPSDCSAVRADTVVVYGEHFPDEFGTTTSCGDGSMTTTMALPTGFWNVYPALYANGSLLVQMEPKVVSIQGDREIAVVFAFSSLPPPPALEPDGQVVSYP